MFAIINYEVKPPRRRLGGFFLATPLQYLYLQDIIKDMKNITQPLKVVALALVLSVGISYVSAWTAPTVTPPNGNVAAPVNTGSTAQTKTGNITANYLFASSESNAPVFKDSNDSAYFVNPNGDSVLWNAFAKGDVCSGYGSGSQKCLSAMNSGVTSLTAGSGISLSGSTGTVTVSSTSGAAPTKGGVIGGCDETGNFFLNGIPSCWGGAYNGGGGCGLLPGTSLHAATVNSNGQPVTFLCIKD